jgi:hypothetical protein
MFVGNGVQVLSPSVNLVRFQPPYTMSPWLVQYHITFYDQFDTKNECIITKSITFFNQNGIKGFALHGSKSKY